MPGFGISREGGTNTHQRYNFVALGQVTDPVRLAMAEAGVVVLPSVIDFVEAEWPMRNGVRHEGHCHR